METTIAEVIAAGLGRRQFLKAIVGGGAATGVAMQGLSATASQSEGDHDVEAGADSTQSRHQWAFVVDLRLCDGCDKCTEACQKAHYLSPDQKWINVYRMTSPGGQEYSMPRLCMQCENPPCLKVCPVGATFMNDEGVVLVDQNTCIGCRMCMAACPYEARYFNWDAPPPAPSLLSQPMPEFPVPQKQGTVGKCILCVHNAMVGKLPACVEGCPMGALYVGDLEADVATNGQDTVKLSTFLRENDAIRFKEELGTRPRVFYIPGHGQDYSYGE
jgi:molybdopterin-containing oxidoreductase family iron-sulfur binding subunit